MEQAAAPGPEFYKGGPSPPYGTMPLVVNNLSGYTHHQFSRGELNIPRYWEYILAPGNHLHLNGVWLPPDEFRWTGDPNCWHPQLLATERERPEMIVVMESGSAFDAEADMRYRWMAAHAPGGDRQALQSLIDFFRRNTAGFGWFVTATSAVQGSQAPTRFYQGWLTPRDDNRQRNAYWL